MLYSSRPGYRIWKALVNGSVQHTYMFKELLSQPHSEFTLLPYNVTNISKSLNSNQFGPLLLFQGKHIVTWNELCIYVLNPENSSIVGTQKHCGFIKSVAVTDTEIFILRQGTDRNLIRISDQPITRPTHQCKWIYFIDFFNDQVLYLGCLLSLCLGPNSVYVKNNPIVVNHSIISLGK